MPKGYWVGLTTITDPEAYEAYRAANGAAFAKYGGRFLVRGGPQEVVEGQTHARTVVLEFPSLQAARDCYASAEYREAMAMREGASVIDLVIVEGVAEG
ncbi:DUF1330 domain-containing protein [Paracoccus sp. S-4012]|uniref:DUF1330 domain-containing protein n=1 Tax=Paracoccus sp. S-4012 TaxID=2665648 RepID=UPI0012B09582|nr:DUF1330 domain-containing protein [Paracoccus sp. S-4012]MRX49201.1 DUF1330 domain-containing protein [Paracoccus sp. S-4012]